MSAVSVVTPTLPALPCPNCKANLLEKGFYNSCSETQRLREDNYAYVGNGRLHIDHEEDNFEMVNHQCDVEAFCRSCNTLLPWPLFKIRHLDGVLLSLADTAIARLLNSHDRKSDA